MPPEATANASPAGQQPKRRRVTLADRLRQASKMQFESPEQIAAREALEKMNRESALATPGDTDSHGVTSAVTADDAMRNDATPAPAEGGTSSSGKTDTAPKTSVAATISTSGASSDTTSPLGASPGKASPTTGSLDKGSLAGGSPAHARPPVTGDVTGDAPLTVVTDEVTSDSTSEHSSPVTATDTGDKSSHRVTDSATDDSSQHPLTAGVTPDTEKHPLTDAAPRDTAVTPMTTAVISDDQRHPMTENATKTIRSHPVTSKVTSSDTPSDASAGAGQNVTQQPEARTVEAVVVQASSMPHEASQALPHTAHQAAPSATSEAVHETAQGTANAATQGHNGTTAPLPAAEEAPCTSCEAARPKATAAPHDLAGMTDFVTATDAVTETQTVTPDAHGHPVTAASTVRHDAHALPLAETPGGTGVAASYAPHTDHTTREATPDVAFGVSDTALTGGAGDTIGGTVVIRGSDAVVTATPETAPEASPGTSPYPSPEAAPAAAPNTAPGAHDAAGTETGAASHARSGTVTQASDTTLAADAIVHSQELSQTLSPALSPAPGAQHSEDIEGGTHTVFPVTPPTNNDTVTGIATNDNDSHPVTNTVTPDNVTTGHVTESDVSTEATDTCQTMAHADAPVAERPMPVDDIHAGTSHSAPDGGDTPWGSAGQHIARAEHEKTPAAHQVVGTTSVTMAAHVTGDAEPHGVTAAVTPHVSTPAPANPATPATTVMPGTLAGLTTSRTLLNSALQVNIYNMVLEAGGAVFTSGGQMAKRFDVAVRSVRRTLDLMETKGILSRESGAAGMTLRLLMDPLSVMGIHASTVPVGAFGEDMAPHLGAGMAAHNAATGFNDESARFTPGMPPMHGAVYGAGWSGTTGTGTGEGPYTGPNAGHDHRPGTGADANRMAGQGTPRKVSGQAAYPVMGTAQSLPGDSHGHPVTPQPASNRQPLAPHMMSAGSAMHGHGQARAGQWHDMGMTGNNPGHAPGHAPRQAMDHATGSMPGMTPGMPPGMTPGMTQGGTPGMMAGPAADVMLFRERYPHLTRAGFGPAQVKQVREALASRDLPDDLVEESLGYAEWELEHGTMVDAKGQPIAKPADWVFKSLAMHGCYRRPAGYVDPLEEARARIAERIAAQTAHREQLARLREEQEKLEMESVIDAEVERLAAAPHSAEVDELLQGLPAVLRAKGLESALVQREMRRRIRERLFPEG